MGEDELLFTLAALMRGPRAGRPQSGLIWMRVSVLPDPQEQLVLSGLKLCAL